MDEAERVAFIVADVKQRDLIREWYRKHPDDERFAALVTIFDEEADKCTS